MGISNGDLNEKTLAIEDSVGHKMKAYVPDLGAIPSPEILLGANIRSFTLALAFQYSSFTEKLTRSEESDPTDVSFLRFGFEFTYNLLWPDDFQVGLGLGYSYSWLHTNNSVEQDGESYRSLLMGSGVAFIANIHYYFTEHVAIVPAIKLYENWFKNVYTGPSELCDLDPYIWQSFYTASISLQFQF